MIAILSSVELSGNDGDSSSNSGGTHQVDLLTPVTPVVTPARQSRRPTTPKPAPSASDDTSGAVMLADGLPLGDAGSLPSPLNIYTAAAINPEQFLQDLRNLVDGEHIPPPIPEEGTPVQELRFSVAKRTKTLTFSISVNKRRLFARMPIIAARTDHMAVEWKSGGERERLFITDLSIIDKEAIFAVHDAVGGLPKGQHQLSVYALEDGLPLVAQGKIQVR